MKFVAAVAPVAVPSERRTLEGEALATALNPVPEVPDDPEEPDDPDDPLDPEDPDVPLDPEEPDDPLDPEIPDVPDDPDVPDLPATAISTRISVPILGVQPVPETYATGNSQYNPASTGFPVTV